ncbi:diacylglycerol kinase [Murinocardiopsis flavida]|uniref:Diacylglycerol kinase n=1 Tax=Murinocardiopsis flavida TaxID=645275 RepID=A0A2P8DLG2_9ACTN|nr:YegS/Rv2252/BmrU family lipid kinase [Murinocardiopsis flavida]PSK98060.1 diacylglycerol kinase [Murinocardiopsis flavida]
MTPRIALLVNPASGSRRAGVAAMSLVRALRAHGARVTIAAGRSAADSVRFAGEMAARRPDALVAVGGDGLVHAAVQGVVGTGVPLGVVAAGTGNDIARSFGLPRAPGDAAEAIIAGAVSDVDAVRVGDRHFLSVLACGFDSRVNARVSAFPLRMGRASYVVGTLAELRTLATIPFRVDVDGTVLSAEGVLVAVGNTDSYGGGMRICPGADPADGLAEVVFVRAASRARLLRFFPRVFTGSHVDLDEVTVLRGKRITISADTEVEAHADGEPLASLPLTCEVVPGAVRVLR